MPLIDQDQIEDKIQQMYHDLGGFGKFQVFAMVAILFGTSTNDLWMNELGYFIQPPDSYICSYASKDNQPSCTKENICANDPAITSWEADPDSLQTL